MGVDFMDVGDGSNQGRRGCLNEQESDDDEVCLPREPGRDAMAKGLQARCRERSREDENRKREGVKPVDELMLEMLLFSDESEKARVGSGGILAFDEEEKAIFLSCLSEYNGG